VTEDKGKAVICRHFEDLNTEKTPSLPKHSIKLLNTNGNSPDSK
jgi:hypothetical protein